uniref:Uncharacterized protein n=1 Tax=Trichinella nativa TaxID=6335 RepID=A0A0V1KI94_9BILA
MLKYEYKVPIPGWLDLVYLTGVLHVQKRVPESLLESLKGLGNRFEKRFMGGA